MRVSPSLAGLMAGALPFFSILWTLAIVILNGPFILTFPMFMILSPIGLVLWVAVGFGLWIWRGRGDKEAFRIALIAGSTLSITTMLFSLFLIGFGALPI
jgi:hypothetical protein